MPDYFLYMVRCRDGSLYTGISVNVKRRIAQHRGGHGSKYLRSRGPLVLVFQAKLPQRSLALKAESRIKRLPKFKKEELVKNPEKIDKIIGLVDK